MGPESEGPQPPELTSAPRAIEAALSREYRVPFRTVVIVVLLAFGFLFAYGEVVKWVQAQVRADRLAIDIRRDEESALQNKQLALHEARLTQLEARSAEISTSLAALSTEVRAARGDIGDLTRAVEQYRRESIQRGAR